MADRSHGCDIIYMILDLQVSLDDKETKFKAMFEYCLCNEEIISVSQIQTCGGDFLRAYKNKEELKTEINKAYEKYISEFDDIPETLKDKRVDEVDRTPAENLAYQVGWTTLVLKWEEDERNGLLVKTPSDEFKWNQLGELHQWFTDTYAHLSLQELKARLNENINSIYAMVDSLSEEELFKPHMRKWADEAAKTAVWEVYKFIHVNTVAPFGTFRTNIRKWKKIVL